MNSENPTGVFENKETKKFGANVKVLNHWVRHTQKQSTEISNVEKNAISTSAISAEGAKRAKTFGENMQGEGKLIKGYRSTSDRTGQTMDNIAEGYKRTRPDVSEGKMRVKKELTSVLPKDFVALYDKKFGAEKIKLLTERGLKSEDFAKLSPNEQESIAEKAEEPVIQEWLDNPDNDLAKLYSPEEAAVQFATLFARHHDIVKKLKSGSHVDLVHVTHKTITEPFLVSGVLIDKNTGKAVTKLSELGGSLQILDDWESDVVTDSEGTPTVTVRMRGKEYDINKTVLERLLAEAK